MAARGPVGLELDLDLVPLREADLQPFEVMLSESQERMLAVVAPERLAEVQAVCDRWELAHAVIGRVVEGDRLVCRWQGEVVGDVPATALVDACPRYPLDPVRPDRLRWASLPARRAGPRAPGDLGAVLLRAARRAERLRQDVGLPPVRPPRRLGHGAAARAATRRSCG